MTGLLGNNWLEIKGHLGWKGSSILGCITLYQVEREDSDGEEQNRAREQDKEPKNKMDWAREQLDKPQNKGRELQDKTDCQGTRQTTE